MPTVIKITGRSSSITNAFINSIIPVIQPNENDIKKALEVLAISINEFQNLTPLCSKCNQSKGNKYWHD